MNRDLNSLRIRLGAFRLDSRDSIRHLRDLREEIVLACNLSPDEIDALPDEPIGLIETLLSHLARNLTEP